MSRVDYWHDRHAPRANSLVPSVTVAVRDSSGRLLLVHRVDNDRWALPGGAMEIGESILDAAVRETYEETAVEVEVTGLVGVYTDPGHVMAYDDGEVRQEFSVCFHAVPTGDTRPSDDGTETRAAAWVEVDRIARLDIHPSMRLRIGHALDRRAEPYLGQGR